MTHHSRLLSCSFHTLSSAGQQEDFLSDSIKTRSDPWVSSVSSTTTSSFFTGSKSVQDTLSLATVISPSKQLQLPTGSTKSQDHSCMWSQTLSLFHERLKGVCGIQYKCSSRTTGGRKWLYSDVDDLTRVSHHHFVP